MQSFQLKRPCFLAFYLLYCEKGGVWNAMSFGAAVGDALGFNASQKAALQLMAMQPDKVPQKKYSEGFQRTFEFLRLEILRLRGV